MSPGPAGEGPGTHRPCVQGAFHALFPSDRPLPPQPSLAGSKPRVCHLPPPHPHVGLPESKEQETGPACPCRDGWSPPLPLLYSRAQLLPKEPARCLQHRPLGPSTQHPGRHLWLRTPGPVLSVQLPPCVSLSSALSKPHPIHVSLTLMFPSPTLPWPWAVQRASLPVGQEVASGLAEREQAPASPTSPHSPHGSDWHVVTLGPWPVCPTDVLSTTHLPWGRVWTLPRVVGSQSGGVQPPACSPWRGRRALCAPLQNKHIVTSAQCVCSGLPGDPPTWC